MLRNTVMAALAVCLWAPLALAEAPLTAEAIAKLFALPVEVTVEASETFLVSPGGTRVLVLPESTAERFLIESTGIVVEVTPGALRSPSALDALQGLFQVWGESSILPARLQSEGLQLATTPLVGAYLSTPRLVVTTDGALPRSDVPAPEAPEVGGWAETAQQLQVAIAATDLPEPARRLLTESVAALDQTATEAEPTPDFIRKLVAHGWFEQLLGPIPGVAQAAEHARRLRTPVPRTIHARSDGIRWTEWVDHFGRVTSTYETVGSKRYSVTLPAPRYYALVEPLTLVAELPPDTKRFFPVERVIAASVYAPSGALLASWNSKSGFNARLSAWRKVLPARKGTARGEMPPHIPIHDQLGDLVELRTAQGSVRPPQSPAPEEIDRFFTDAAKVLSSAARLDLVGQYFMHYTFDSPATEQPLLVGSTEVHGDIHQSAGATMATTLGGTCRGDCDDLAEVYQEISRRQGKVSHIMSIPAHNALCWGEQDKKKKKWHVYVLQTGPVLETVADNLPDALAEAYGHFLGGATFDPDGIGLSLRFSGENTRGTWGLGWRIFADADYAATMIDVQRDWHFKTYHRAILKMRQLIADGDLDPANYKELAGLARATGQWQLGARYQEVALEAFGDRTLHVRLEMLRMLGRAHDVDAVTALARQLIDKDLPRALRVEGEPAIDSMLMAAASLLQDLERVGLAAEILEKFLADYFEKGIARFNEWVTEQQPTREAMQSEPVALRLRLNLMVYGELVSLVLLQGQPGEVSEATLTRLGSPIVLYYRDFAFRHADGARDVTLTYALLGRYLAAREGLAAFASRLAQVELPTTAKDHTTADPEMLSDENLRWIKASVPYWAGLVAWYLRDEALSLDRAGLLAACAGMVEANGAAKGLGLDLVTGDETLTRAELVLAVLEENEPKTRLCMRTLARHADKSATDSAVEAIGGIARWLTPAWFAQMLEIWAAEVNTAPSYFGFAWAAQLHGAPEHALLAAQLATRQFPDEPAFAEELEYLRRLQRDDPELAAEKEIRLPPKAERLRAREELVGTMGASLRLSGDWHPAKTTRKVVGQVFENSEGIWAQITEGKATIFTEASVRVTQQQFFANSALRLEGDVNFIPADGGVIHGHYICTGKVGEQELTWSTHLLGRDGLNYSIAVWGTSEQRDDTIEVAAELAAGLAFPPADSDWGKSTQPRRVEGRSAGIVVSLEHQPSLLAELAADDRGDSFLALGDADESLAVYVFHAKNLEPADALPEVVAVLQKHWEGIEIATRDEVNVDGRVASRWMGGLDGKQGGLALVAVPLQGGGSLDMRFVLSRDIPDWEPLCNKLLASITISEPEPQDAFPAVTTAELRAEDMLPRPFWQQLCEQSKPVALVGPWTALHKLSDAEALAVSWGAAERIHVVDGSREPLPELPQGVRSGGFTIHQGRILTCSGGQVIELLGSEWKELGFAAEHVASAGAKGLLVVPTRQPTQMLGFESVLDSTPVLLVLHAEAENRTVAELPAQLQVTRLACDNAGLHAIVAVHGGSAWQGLSPAVLIIVDLASGETRQLNSWKQVANLTPADGGWLVTGRAANSPPGIYFLGIDGTSRLLVAGLLSGALELSPETMLVARSAETAAGQAMTELRTIPRAAAESLGATPLPWFPELLAEIARAGFTAAKLPPIAESLARRADRERLLEAATAAAAERGLSLPSTAEAIADLLDAGGGEGPGDSSRYLLMIALESRALELAGAIWIDGTSAPAFGEPMSSARSNAHAYAANVLLLQDSEEAALELSGATAASVISLANGRQVIVGTDEQALLLKLAELHEPTDALFASGDAPAIVAHLQAHPQNLHLRELCYQTLAGLGRTQEMEGVAQVFVAATEPPLEEDLRALLAARVAQPDSADSYDSLVEQLRSAIAAHPMSASFYVLLGQVYSAGSSPDAKELARPCFTRALEIASWGSLSEQATAGLEALDR